MYELRCLPMLTAFSPPSISSALGDTTHNLSFPLNPKQHFGYKLDGHFRTFQRGPPMKGGQFIYICTSEAYKIWRLTKDAPFHSIVKARFEPFLNIEIRLEGTAVAPDFATPLKMGIGLLLMTNRFFHDARKWPAGFVFDVVERKSITIGTISVKQTLGGTIEPMKESQGNSTAQSLFGDIAKGLTVHTPNINPLPGRIDERQWLFCFNSIVWWAYTHRADSNVLQGIPRGATLHWKNVPRLICDLSITHRMPETITWGQFAAGLLIMLRGWAVRDVWEPVERGEMRFHNEVIASIRIRPHNPLADDGEVATA